MRGGRPKRSIFMHSSGFTFSAHLFWSSLTRRRNESPWKGFFSFVCYLFSIFHYSPSLFCSISFVCVCVCDCGQFSRDQNGVGHDEGWVWTTSSLTWPLRSYDVDESKVGIQKEKEIVQKVEGKHRRGKGLSKSSIAPVRITNNTCLNFLLHSIFFFKNKKMIIPFETRQLIVILLFGFFFLPFFFR